MAPVIPKRESTQIPATNAKKNPRVSILHRKTPQPASDALITPSW
jgi:hypothetical protein